MLDLTKLLLAGRSYQFLKYGVGNKCDFEEHFCYNTVTTCYLLLFGTNILGRYAFQVMFAIILFQETASPNRFLYFPQGRPAGNRANKISKQKCMEVRENGKKSLAHQLTNRRKISRICVFNALQENDDLNKKYK